MLLTRGIMYFEFLAIVLLCVPGRKRTEGWKSECLISLIVEFVIPLSTGFAGLEVLVSRMGSKSLKTDVVSVPLTQPGLPSGDSVPLIAGVVLFSRPVLSDTLQPHGPQHTRLLCPSPSPGARANSRPLSWGCHSTISSSVVTFCSCLQSFPASGSFPMSQLFASGGRGIGS